MLLLPWKPTILDKTNIFENYNSRALRLPILVVKVLLKNSYMGEGLNDPTGFICYNQNVLLYKISYTEKMHALFSYV